MILLNRNFALLWAGQLVSQLGDKLYNIALLWWVLEKTGSPFFTSSFLLLATLPELLLGPLAGVFVDRWNRQIILIACDWLRAGIVAVLAVLLQAGDLQIWHVFVAAFCISACSALANPAIQALIPAVVAPQRLQDANARSQMIAGATRIIGPLAGAASVATIGNLPALYLNAVSYLLCGMAECLLRLSADQRPAGSAWWRSLREGLRHVAGNRQVTEVLRIVALVHVFFGTLIAVLPFVARRLGGHGIGNLGVLEASLGFGIVAGSLWLARRDGRASFAWPMLGMAGWTALLAMLQFWPSVSLLACALCCAGIGLGVAQLSILWQTTIQREVPDTMRGRVFSVLSSIGNVSVPLAIGAAGLLLRLAPVQLLLALCAAGLAVGGVRCRPSGAVIEAE
jgi:MFS family permease